MLTTRSACVCRTASTCARKLTGIGEQNRAMAISVPKLPSAVAAEESTALLSGIAAAAWREAGLRVCNRNDVPPFTQS